MKPPKEVEKYLRTSGKKIIYSSNPIQAYDTSVMCGYYCLFFIAMMNKGYDVYDIIYRFGLKNEKSNDKILLENIILLV